MSMFPIMIIAGAFMLISVVVGIYGVRKYKYQVFRCGNQEKALSTRRVQGFSLSLFIKNVFIFHGILSFISIQT